MEKQANVFNQGNWYQRNIGIHKEAEKIGVKQWAWWYGVLGVIGFSPILLAYRKCYKAAVAIIAVSIWLLPVFGYGPFTNAFNCFMTGVAGLVYHLKVKKAMSNPVGNSQEEKEEYIKTVCGINKMAALITGVIYVGFLCVVGYYASQY